MSKRFLAAAAVIVAAMVGVGANAPGASAAPVPWYPWEGLDARWHCSSTVDQYAYYEQFCTIVSGRNYQAAVILVPRVDNEFFETTVTNVRNRANGATRTCRSGLRERERVVCYSPTQTGNAGDNVQGRFRDHYNEEFFSPTTKLS
jgi:hypothetical protein